MSIYLDNTSFSGYYFDMVMQSNYLDYNRISEIEDELREVKRKLETSRYFDEEFYDRELKLAGELKKLIYGEPVEVEGKSCEVKHCGGGHIYYPGKVHHLDGNPNNGSFGNLAMVCPKCRAHVLLSRFNPEDIWLLKARGLSNAGIGRILNISRERVRQLCKKYEVKHKAELTALLEANPDDLIKKAEYIENHLIANGRLRRRIDKRTKKKRIIAQLNKLLEAFNKTGKSN